jgi:hypothetical protein
MARYTLIQSGDFNAAENVGALAGDIKREGIVDGLELSNLDTAAPSIDVAAGKTVHIVSTQVAEATLDDGTTVAEQRDQVQLVAHVDSQTVSLTEDTTNELFLDPRVDTDDSPRVEVVTTGTPSSNAVKIGSVDTGTDTVSSQWNLINPDGTLSFPDQEAATASLTTLPDGTTVLDRSSGTRLTNGALDASTITADSATISGIEIPDEIDDTRNAVNQLFIQNAEQDFELGLSLLQMDDGQFEVYANNDRIADSLNVDLNLGSPTSGNGTVSLANGATSGFTEHDVEDFGFVPNAVWVTDDIDTNPTNGTVEYEIADENGNVVTIPTSETESNVDVSGTIETFGVTTRAVLKRDAESATSPVLDAYSVYISGQVPDDYLEARVTGVSEQ